MHEYVGAVEEVSSGGWEDEDFILESLFQLLSKNSLEEPKEAAIIYDLKTWKGVIGWKRMNIKDESWCNE